MAASFFAQKRKTHQGLLNHRTGGPGNPKPWTIPTASAVLCFRADNPKSHIPQRMKRTELLCGSDPDRRKPEIPGKASEPSGGGKLQR